MQTDKMDRILSWGMERIFTREKYATDTIEECYKIVGCKFRHGTFDGFYGPRQSGVSTCIKIFCAAVIAACGNDTSIVLICPTTRIASLYASATWQLLEEISDAKAKRRQRLEYRSVESEIVGFTSIGEEVTRLRGITSYTTADIISTLNILCDFFHDEDLRVDARIPVFMACSGKSGKPSIAGLDVDDAALRGLPQNEINAATATRTTQA